MKLYVNYYDREVAGVDDNPTLGLILCTDKNDAVVRYVLDKDQETIVASRYQMALPSEAVLAAEVRREMAALALDRPLPGVMPRSPARKRKQRRPKTTRKGIGG
jgi:YhcG PDDEXK nuclease domain